MGGYERTEQGDEVATGLAPGNFVVVSNGLGFGRVAKVDGDLMFVEYFESAAEPVVHNIAVPASSVRRVRLGVETRVFFQDSGGVWYAGRIVGGGPERYAVRVPNGRLDFDIAEGQLRVRWDRPPRDPLQLLLAGANETGRFRDTRMPVRALMLEERAACASATGIISSGAQIHAHQVGAALRILHDPVQRYLLADEVGMGKTIQAGFVIRQTLIDDPKSSVVVIAPDALRRQWQQELQSRFFTEDFDSRRIRIAAHEDPDGWGKYHKFTLVVVDEAHLLAAVNGPREAPYRQMAQLCKAVPRVLLLSATPTMQREETHLGLLHLLDSGHYRWDDVESFRAMLAVRRELARAIYALDSEPDPDIPGLLQFQFDEIRAMLPEDPRFDELTAAAMTLFEGESLRPGAAVLDLNRAVAAVRAHVAETYRLHHRVIRNRRATVLASAAVDDWRLTPFEVTGRRRPTILLTDPQLGSVSADLVDRWYAAVRDEILNQNLDPGPYGQVLGVLVSRIGGPPTDLLAALRVRLTGQPDPSFTDEELRILLAAKWLPVEADCFGEFEGEALADLVAVLRPAARAGRAIIFCGKGSLAHSLAGHLASNGSFGRVWEHTVQAGAARADEAVAGWRSSGGVLVCDDSGEAGRNFQEANLVVHARVPWHPNTLEQRIGRVDRYGSHPTADQKVVTEPDSDSLHRCWLHALAHGFGVFDDSISALQEPVDRLLPRLWGAAMADGWEQLRMQVPNLTKSLAAELRYINEMDELESNFDSFSGERDTATRLAVFESDPKRLELGMRELLVSASGFRLTQRRNRDGSLTFDRGQGAPLISPPALTRLMVPEDSRTGLFDRWSLRAFPGRRLFRQGNPFIDAVGRLLVLDDRGQATAFWRVDREWPNDPLPYFGFDFLVQADSAPVIALLGSGLDRGVRATLRRRADAALPPFSLRVWIPADADTAADDAAIRILEAPYRKERGDVNLNPKRIAALHELFGGRRGFSDRAVACQHEARMELGRIAELDRRIGKATQRLELDTAVLAAKAQARKRAGSLVAEVDGLSLDASLAEALAVGVAKPKVEVIAVSCVVRSRVHWQDHVRR